MVVQLILLSPMGDGMKVQVDVSSLNVVAVFQNNVPFFQHPCDEMVRVTVGILRQGRHLGKDIQSGKGTQAVVKGEIGNVRKSFFADNFFQMESSNYSKRSWGEVKNLRFFTTRDNPCSSLSTLVKVTWDGNQAQRFSYGGEHKIVCI